jgi:predicted DsbA family dithiol-disulfide isomerase
VRHDENQAGELGISGVPSLLIDGKFMVVGAQGSDQLLSVLQRAWARRTAA